MRTRKLLLACLCAVATFVLPPVIPALASGGVIVRSSSGGLVFRRGCDDVNGAIVTTGTTTLKLAELEDDGTLKTYDFSTNTFVTTTVTTETVSMTNRTMNNGADPTGIWTYSLGTVSGFTKGKIYFIVTSNSLASPIIDRTEFEYGGADGDVSLDSTGAANISYTQTVPTAPTAGTTGESLFYGIQSFGRRNTAQGGTTSTITLDTGASTVDNFYVGHGVKIYGGTGSGQFATITGYVGSTKVATITRPGVGTWTTTPDNTSTYFIEPATEALVYSNLDKTAYVLSSSEHTAISGTDVPTALTAQGYTTSRAAKLDNSDVATSTRLATSGYTSPPSAASIVNQILATATPSVPTTGTIGEAFNFVETRVDAAVSTRSTKSDVKVTVVTKP